MKPGLLAAAAIGWALLPACRRAPPPDERAKAPASTTAVASQAGDLPPSPPDHLSPGELVEGPAQAFGLALPKVIHVEATFVDVVYADAPASVHALAAYFQRRLEDGSAHEGPSAATFEHVHVRGKAGRELTIRVAAGAGGSIVEIRDSTPPKATNLPDEPARWRHAGMTPNGRLLDPTHLD
jgi:hypothetical protein